MLKDGIEVEGGKIVQLNSSYTRRWGTTLSTFVSASFFKEKGTVTSEARSLFCFSNSYQPSSLGF